MTPYELFRQELAVDLGSTPYRRSGVPSKFVITAKSYGILAGVDYIPLVLELLEREFFLPTRSPSPVCVTNWVFDGDGLNPGMRIAQLDGDAELLLKAERTILNTLQRLSGIAGYTTQCVAMVAHMGVKLLDTRKSPALYRMLDKEAFRLGGGHPHRADQDDGPMVKDNDIAVYGLRGAIDRKMHEIRAQQKLEVEVGSPKLLEAVLSDGRADIIMLDNMSPVTLRLLVERIRREPKRYTIEASGIGSYGLREIAETGVDAISSSSFVTKGAGDPPDLSMKVVQ